MATHDTLTELFENIADAIRYQLDEEESTETQIVADNFPAAINTIVTLNHATAGDNATSADILYGKTAHAKGQLLSGTIPIQDSLAVAENVVTAPAGYYALATSTAIAAATFSSENTNALCTPNMDRTSEESLTYYNTTIPTGETDPVGFRNGIVYAATPPLGVEAYQIMPEAGLVSGTTNFNISTNGFITNASNTSIEIGVDLDSDLNHYYIKKSQVGTFIPVTNAEDPTKIDYLEAILSPGYTEGQAIQAPASALTVQSNVPELNTERTGLQIIRNEQSGVDELIARTVFDFKQDAGLVISHDINNVSDIPIPYAVIGAETNSHVLAYEDLTTTPASYAKTIAVSHSSTSGISSIGSTSIPETGTEYYTISFDKPSDFNIKSTSEPRYNVSTAGFNNIGITVGSENVVVNNIKITAPETYYVNKAVISSSLNTHTISGSATTDTGITLLGSAEAKHASTSNISTIGTTTKPSGAAGTDYYQITFATGNDYKVTSSSKPQYTVGTAGYKGPTGTTQGTEDSISRRVSASLPTDYYINHAAISAETASHTVTGGSITVSYNTDSTSDIGTTTKPSGTLGTNYYQITFNKTADVTVTSKSTPRYNVSKAGYNQAGTALGSEENTKTNEVTGVAPATYYINHATIAAETDSHTVVGSTTTDTTITLLGSIETKHASTSNISTIGTTTKPSSGAAGTDYYQITFEKGDDYKVTSSSQPRYNVSKAGYNQVGTALGSESSINKRVSASLPTDYYINAASASSSVVNNTSPTFTGPTLINTGNYSYSVLGTGNANIAFTKGYLNAVTNGMYEVSGTLTVPSSAVTTGTYLIPNTTTVNEIDINSYKNVNVYSIEARLNAI